jgi:hypothetical protein
MGKIYETLLNLGERGKIVGGYSISEELGTQSCTRCTEYRNGNVGSCLRFVIVVAATWLSVKKIQAPAFEFSAVRAPIASIWGRYGLWTAVAVLIVLPGYAYPIVHLLMQHRYGSAPYQPF